MTTTVERFGGLSNAGFLLVKVCAFGVMILDHLDWFVFDGALGVHGTIGRAVFPAFAAIIGINLARMNVASMRRLTARLLIGSAVALVPYTMLQGALLPLCILATYVVAVVVVMLLRTGSALSAFVTWAVCSLFVDYQWFGVAAVVVAWLLVSRGWGGAFLAAALLVVPFNGSWWSLAVLPLAWVGSMLPAGPAPRWKALFYVGYPVHLVALCMVNLALGV